jgi:hypothetical protein
MVELKTWNNLEKTKQDRLASFLISAVVLALAWLFAESPAFAVTAPTISPASGTYAMGSGPTVTMSAPAGQIFYTLDGSQPSSANGTLYSTSFQINETTQINAVALSSGTYSSVTTAPIAIDSNYTSITSTAAPSFWYRGDVSIVANSGILTGLADISGHGSNATATAPNQPTMQANYLNDVSVVNFNHTVNGQFISIPTISSGFSGGFSAFIVMQNSTPTSGAQVLSFGNGSNLNNAMGVSTNSSLAPNFYVYDSSGTQSAVASSTAFPSGQFQLLEVVQSGTTATLLTNGLVVGQSTSMNALPTSSLSSNFIGQLTTGGSFFSGGIAELVIYPSAVTTQQRETIEAYMIQKYQIPQQTLAAPIFSLPAGSLNGPTQVAVWTPLGATTYYTTDGSTPTSGSSVYAAPLTISYTSTLKALAIYGNQQSSVTSASYSLDPIKFPAPSTGGPILHIYTPLPSTAIP